ncbi:hypothetical protein [Neisseria sp. Ec49-e6-T10]|uniref:hypothetical protein n=1 Tax=Neisseria sp. Ec49-e6-T10 TaxID=3140744 RepID=UPI003EB7AE38
MITPITIDKHASANAPWQLNTIIPNTETTILLLINNTYTPHKVYRKFLGITPEGCITIQDFYVDTSGLNCRTDPYLLLATVNPATFPYQKPTYGIEGNYCVYYPNYNIESEAYFTQGLLQGSYIHRNDKNHRVSEIYYINGQVQGVITYTKQQDIFQQIWGLNLIHVYILKIFFSNRTRTKILCTYNRSAHILVGSILHAYCS